jgi:hypothetical protein
MGELNKDIFIGGLFMGGLFGFFNGAYVVSSALFASIAVVNYLYDSFKQTETV